MKHNEDLFKDTTMTFGEHLDELRTSLFKAVAGLIVGCLLGLLVGDKVVWIITGPLTKALGTYYQTDTKDRFEKLQKERVNDGLQPLPYSADEIKKLVDEQSMLFEVQYAHPARTLASLSGKTAPAIEAAPEAGNGELSDGSAKPASEPPSKTPLLDKSMLVPILLWHPVASDDRIRPIALGTSEAFTIWMKASLVVGLIISSPWVFYHVWTFIAAGLYPHEKKYVHLFLPFSLGLFLLGAATAYLFVFQPVLGFLLGFNSWLGLDPDPRITEWLGFVLVLPLGFGISFQLPLVMLFLERIGIFDVAGYLQKWRLAVLVIFVLSAILTPADPYSLLLMALPLCFLYFAGILLCRLLPRSHSTIEPA